MQPTRLKLLTVGPQNVYPPIDGGRESIYGALQALSSYCDVTYAYPSDGVAPLQAYADAGVHAIPVPWVPHESMKLIVSATLALRPYKFEKYSGPAALAAFDKHIPSAPYDAIICFHAHTARLGEGLRRLRGLQAPVLVREHNIEYGLVASFRESLPFSKRLAALPFEMLTRREEQRIWERADSVAFISDSDLFIAQKSGVSGRLFLAPEGVPRPMRRETAYPGSDAPLLILLNPKATQSVVNLRDFLHLFWKAASVDSRLAGTALHVTGVTTEQLAALVGIDARGLTGMRVHGLGFLDSLAPLFKSSLVLISPTFVGGGIRKKILEAMANQLPVIATDLDITSTSYFARGENILPMTDVNDFCAQVHRLRTDARRWGQLSEAGRDTVDRHASWDKFALSIVDEIVALRGPAAP
jgi:glycosyltransferase involved in cell wall biosynthesis